MRSTEQRMFGGGDVADRVDVGVAGAQRRVDQDAAVADGQPGLFGEPDVGCRADRDQDRVGGDGRAVTELQPGGVAAGGGDLVDRRTQPQVDAVVAMQFGEHLADFAAERRHAAAARRLRRR